VAQQTTELTVSLKVNDQGTAALTKMQNAIGGMQTAINAITGSAFVYLGQQILNAGKQFAQFYEQTARAVAIEESFKMIATASGVMSDQLIKDISRASGVFVEQTEIMVKAQRLLVEGFNSDEIVKMTEASRIAARKMGITVKEAYDLVTEAIITGRTRGLKAVFPIDPEEAYAKYAEMLGTIPKYLTEAGKHQAILNEVIRQSNEYVKIYGKLVENEYERVQKLKSGWEEVKEAIGKAFFRPPEYGGTTMGGIWASPEEARKRIEEQEKIRKSIQGTYLEEDYPIAGGLTAPQAQKLTEERKIKEDQNRLNLEYDRKILSIGYLTYQDKLNQLEAERQVAIEKAKGLDISKINQSFAKQAVELKKQEGDRIQGLNLQFAKLVAEAQNLSDLGTMPDWRDSLDFIQKGWIRVNGELREVGAWLPTDKVLQLNVAFQKVLYDVERLQELGEMPDWRESLEKAIPKGYMEKGGVRIPIAEVAGAEERTVAKLNLERQYLELLSEHSNNVKDLITNNKALEDSEVRRLETLRDATPGLREYYQTQIDLVKKVGQEIRTQMANKEVVDAVTDVARSMSSAWSSGLMEMINGTKTFAEAMKSIITSMGNIIIKKLLEISMNYLLMGNITGTNITGGLFGGIGNLFGGGGSSALSISGGAAGITGSGAGGAASFVTGFEMLQHGTDYVPRTGLAMLHKGEAVIPAEKNKGGGDTNNYNTFIQATDLGSFTRLYGPTIESIYYKGRRFNKVSARS